jgi:uncharacterized caspase-like protein
VGIDNYPGHSNLNGCVADATAMDNVLQRNDDGTRNWDTQLVVGASTSPAVVTRGRLRGLMSELFSSPRDTDLLFFFAGHGVQTGWGAELVTQDAAVNSMGVSMNDLLTLANASAARSVTLILDCCFSGDLGNAPNLQSDAVAEGFRLGRAVLNET